ncbi:MULTISPECIES: DUF2281 domain-containing protein [Marinobacter]|jgi:hypothetical protein|uniref:DUF2281 domain-containing protein n=1 Tax=Marinobacter TaxID=2742 RepID=UPI00077473D4|nr:MULTISPECIES: DUF2281 domain-containing protein [Marinobacter]MCD1631451.1 DUF2281 domain-containing protein [Marinobacter shengliensis]
MDNRVQQVIKKLEHLPADRLSEVEDFIDFLSQRDREHHTRKDFARGAEPSFQKVWDNDDDAAYDKL